MSDGVYERLGGRKGIRAVVNDFYETLTEDDELSGFFEDADVGRLKDAQTEFLCEAAGGPESYDGEAVREAHVDVPLEPSDVRRAVAVLRETLESHGVREDDVDAVTAVIAARERELVADGTP